MTWLLTWSAYGTWLPGGRGRIDVDCAAEPLEPERVAPAQSLRWPSVKLDPAQRKVVAGDIQRIAELRRFAVRLLIVAEDHVHLALTPAEGELTGRLVQLIKGSLSRTLSAHAGDRPALGSGGDELPHHKWWSRQHAVQRLEGDEHLRVIAEQLLARHDRDCECVAPSPRPARHDEGPSL